MTKILRIDEFVKVDGVDFTTTTTQDVYKKNAVRRDEPSKGFKIIRNAVTDVDGNSYDGIEIGGKVWMASNLRVTAFNDGSHIDVYGKQGDTDTPFFTVPENGNAQDKYGFLYNLPAVLDGRLAPEGWHIPSSGEYEELFEFLAEMPEYNLSYDSNRSAYGSWIAKSMCSKEGWNACRKEESSPGWDCELNDKTGFGLFPAGCLRPRTGCYGTGNEADLWCSDRRDDGRGIYFYVMRCSRQMDYSECYGDFGFSVRCVKDR